MTPSEKSLKVYSSLIYREVRNIWNKGILNNQRYREGKLSISGIEDQSEAL